MACVASMNEGSLTVTTLPASWSSVYPNRRAISAERWSSGASSWPSWIDDTFASSLAGAKTLRYTVAISTPAWVRSAGAYRSATSDDFGITTAVVSPPSSDVAPPTTNAPIATAISATVPPIANRRC